MRKAVPILITGILIFQAFAVLAEAAEKTMQITVEGCRT